MGRFKDAGSDDEAETTIDMSPLIDCVFILLIFFIVTTVFVEEKGLQVAKPDAAAASAVNDEKDNVLLEITQQNKVLLNDKEVAIADVASGVKSRRGALARLDRHPLALLHLARAQGSANSPGPTFPC